MADFKREYRVNMVNYLEYATWAEFITLLHGLSSSSRFMEAMQDKNTTPSIEYSVDDLEATLEGLAK